MTDDDRQIRERPLLYGAGEGAGSARPGACRRNRQEVSCYLTIRDVGAIREYRDRWHGSGGWQTRLSFLRRASLDAA